VLLSSRRTPCWTPPRGSLPAFASWSSFARWGAGPPLLSAYRPPKTGPQRGCHVSHHELWPGWVPRCPGDCGARTTGAIGRPSHAPFQRPVPIPQHRIHHLRLKLTRHQSRVHNVHPSRLPLACDPRMERQPLGLNPELHTPPLPAAHVEVGTGTRALPGLRHHHQTSPPFYVTTHYVRLRVAPRAFIAPTEPIGAVRCRPLQCSEQPLSTVAVRQYPLFSLRDADAQPSNRGFPTRKTARPETGRLARGPLGHLVTPPRCHAAQVPRRRLPPAVGCLCADVLQARSSHNLGAHPCP
jgi:hypothetical protein